MFKLLVWFFPDSLSQDALLSCLQKAGGVNWGGKSRGVLGSLMYKPTRWPFEQWKKPWLFTVYRGLYYPIIWGL